MSVTGTMMNTKSLSFRGHAFQIAYLDDYPQHPSWYSFDDESSVRDRDWKVESGDVVLDVGAAYGSYALTALAVGASHVFAWSPQDEAALSTSGHAPGMLDKDVLAQSLRLNGWEERCTVYGTGAYDRAGWLNTTTQEFSDSPVHHPDWIEVDTLDNWFSRVRPDLGSGRVWLKVDVEGAEVAVLRGATGLIGRIKPVILVENHLFKDGDIARKCEEVVMSAGAYSVRTFPYHSVSHSIYMPRTMIA